MRILSTALFSALLLLCPSLSATCTFGFLSPVSYPANGNTGDVTTGDFNRDGFVDVVVVNRTLSQISLLPGTAGGGLGSPTTIATDWSQGDIQAADFNNDGKLDLVLALPWSNNFTVYPHLKILLGNGNGGFTAVAYTDQQLVFQNPQNIVLGDFNHDGKIDAATVKADAQWSAMQNVGGKLAQKAHYETGGGVASGIAVGDFDGDGHSDIAIAASLARKVFTYFGVGDGTFTAGATTLEFPHAQREPVDVEAGDFNGDGKDDLAIVFYNPYGGEVTSGPLRISLSNGLARTFGAPADFGALPYAREVLVAHSRIAPRRAPQRHRRCTDKPRIANGDLYRRRTRSGNDGESHSRRATARSDAVIAAESSSSAGSSATVTLTNAHERRMQRRNRAHLSRGLAPGVCDARSVARRF